MKKLAILVCFVLAFVVTACANTPPATGSTCVFQDKPVKVTREYQGKEVGFCCKKCANKWDGMSDAEKDAALAKKG